MAASTTKWPHLTPKVQRWPQWRPWWPTRISKSPAPNCRRPPFIRLLPPPRVPETPPDTQETKAEAILITCTTVTAITTADTETIEAIPAVLEDITPALPVDIIPSSTTSVELLEQPPHQPILQITGEGWPVLPTTAKAPDPASDTASLSASRPGCSERFTSGRSIEGST